jgi:hypothetical protein
MKNGTVVSQDNSSLVRVVDRFTQLSKDYVELQSKYEQTKEELNQEKTRVHGDSHYVGKRSEVADSD